MNQKLVMIDVSWLAHRAKHTMGGLSYEGDPTGVIFGCLEEMRKICMGSRVRSNRVAVCFDGPKSFCFRRKVYPEYKKRGKNDPTPEQQQDSAAMFAQLRTLRKEVLPAIGFPVLRQVGLEADDMMAQAVVQLRNGPGVMITADQDLLQCITDYVHWYDPSRDYYVDPSILFNDKRVGPAEWAEVKCLAGCKSDNVKGVRGVGEKTATDYIWKLLPATSKKLYAIRCADGLRTARTNRGLVVLPHRMTKPVDLTPPTYNAEGFYEVCRRFGFRSFLDGRRRTEWDMFFNNVMDVEERQAAGARKPGQSR